MLPLRDNIRSRGFPLVNTAIIVTCVVVFLWQVLVDPDQGLRYAFFPRALLSPAAVPELGGMSGLVGLFTSIFLHGGLAHVSMNMLFLWVFGDNVEDRMGHLRYLVFYVLCGVLGNLAHALMSGFAPLPLVGASGAISGVMGAYFVLFRMAYIRTFAFLLFYPVVFDLPASVFLFYWFILQLFAGLGSLGMASGVAFWAHVGGFGAGYLLVRRFARPLRPPPARPIYPRVVNLRIE